MHLHWKKVQRLWTIHSVAPGIQFLSAQNLAEARLKENHAFPSCELAAKCKTHRPDLSCPGASTANFLCFPKKSLGNPYFHPIISWFYGFMGFIHSNIPLWIFTFYHSFIHYGSILWKGLSQKNVTVLVTFVRQRTRLHCNREGERSSCFVVIKFPGCKNATDASNVGFCLETTVNTVDGQNPAPPRMMIIPLFIGFLTIPGGAGFCPSTVCWRIHEIIWNHS